MSRTIFGAFLQYLKHVWWGFGSIFSSSVAALPQLFGMGELRKKVTEQYPDPISSRTEDDLPPKTRGLLFNDIDKCTGCGDCRKICPVECIQIETVPGADLSRISVAVFDIDFGRCIFCGLCVSVCHPGSLVHTKRFEASAFQLTDLIVSYGRGKNVYE